MIFLKGVFVQASIRDKDIFLDFFFTRVFIAETDMMRIWLACLFHSCFCSFYLQKKKRKGKKEDGVNFKNNLSMTKNNCSALLPRQGAKGLLLYS